MRVVIIYSPAARPRDTSRELGADCCDGAFALIAGNCRREAFRGCGWSGLQRGRVALALAAGRRLVCVCCDDGLQKWLCAGLNVPGKRPLRTAPKGAPQFDSCTDHHQSFNL
jgi:hypothetical protein